MAQFMKGYIDELKARTAEAERLRQEREDTERARQAAIYTDVRPLTVQIEELMRSLPPAQRDRTWTMEELVYRLEAKSNKRPSAGEVGKALRALGWSRKRDWSKESDGCRVWIPN